MMGTKERRFLPLANPSLEDLVPADHFYRYLERSLDLSFVRDLVRDRYAPGGRPSVDPVVFFTLQLVMFFEGVRSERQLMQVVADRLSLRWYFGYDLTEPLPDHSSLSRIRERYGLDIVRRFFQAIVAQCLAAGLVWGRGLYFDATKVEANDSLDSVAPRFAVEVHLGALFTVADAPEDVDEGGHGEGPALLPIELTAEAQAMLADVAGSRHDWIGKAEWPHRTVVRGDYQRVADFHRCRLLTRVEQPYIVKLVAKPERRCLPVDARPRGGGCCPSGYPKCCDRASEASPGTLAANSCNPTSYVCCRIAEGGGSCHPNRPRRCPATDANPSVKRTTASPGGPDGP